MLQSDVLPLMSVFQRLRQKEFPLIMDQYELLLSAMEKRYGLNINSYFYLLENLSNESEEGIELQAELKSKFLTLTKLLWFKPGQSAQSFLECFEEGFIEDRNQVKLSQQSEKKALTKPTSFPNDQNATTDTPLQTDLSENPKELIGDDLVIDNSDSTEEAIAVRLAAGKRETDNTLNIKQERNLHIENSKFLFTPDYFPIDKRKSKQNIRHLRFSQKGVNTNQPDLPATIEKVMKAGSFTEIVYQRSNLNKTKILLFIDHLGSMAAFEPFNQFLSQELKLHLDGKSSSKNSSLKTYYFYNCLDQAAYEDKAHTKFCALETLIAKNRTSQPGVIIVSDAGAARNSLNPQRINSTKKFLLELNNITSKIAWINPLPPSRWKGNNAEVIAQMVSMFEADDNGIKNAVGVLKGTNNNKVSIHERKQQV